jgi:CheY-like chemotaxis protein
LQKEMERRPRVLAIDDDPDFREGLEDVLDDLGYAVTAAASGREALEALRTEPRPDVILLDLRMPDMDGRTFRREQLRDSTLSQIPCVVVSGSREVEEEARSLGAAAVLAKPFRVRTLIDSIDRVTKN